jgi:hypothetical protein
MLCTRREPEKILYTPLDTEVRLLSKLFERVPVYVGTWVRLDSSAMIQGRGCGGEILLFQHGILELVGGMEHIGISPEQIRSKDTSA